MELPSGSRVRRFESCWALRCFLGNRALTWHDAGIWFVGSETPVFKMAHARKIVADSALAPGGVLLIIATHWGHSDSP
jgi:hypothetical protein